jgi:hypothetical protein
MEQAAVNQGNHQARFVDLAHQIDLNKKIIKRRTDEQMMPTYWCFDATHEQTFQKKIDRSAYQGIIRLPMRTL